MSQKYIIPDSKIFAMRICDHIVDSVWKYENEKYKNRDVLAVYPDSKGVPKQDKGIKILSAAFIVNGKSEESVVSNIFLSKNEKTKEYLIRIEESKLGVVVEILVKAETIDSKVYSYEDSEEEPIKDFYNALMNELDEFCALCGMNNSEENSESN